MVGLDMCVRDVGGIRGMKPGGERGGVGKNMQQIRIEDNLGSSDMKPTEGVNKPSVDDYVPTNKLAVGNVTWSWTEILYTSKFLKCSLTPLQPEPASLLPSCS